MDRQINLEEKNNEQREQCVMCKSETEYFCNQPITERQYYIEGAGQLCRQCYYKIYGEEK